MVLKNAEHCSVAAAANEEPLLVPSIARRQLSALHFALAKMCLGSPSGAASTELAKKETTKVRKPYIGSYECQRWLKKIPEQVQLLLYAHNHMANSPASSSTWERFNGRQQTASLILESYSSSELFF